MSMAVIPRTLHALRINRTLGMLLPLPSTMPSCQYRSMCHYLGPLPLISRVSKKRVSSPLIPSRSRLRKSYQGPSPTSGCCNTPGPSITVPSHLVIVHPRSLQGFSGLRFFRLFCGPQFHCVEWTYLLDYCTPFCGLDRWYCKCLCYSCSIVPN